MRCRPRLTCLEWPGLLELVPELLVDPAWGGVFAGQLLEAFPAPRRLGEPGEDRSDVARRGGGGDLLPLEPRGDGVQIGEVRGDRRRRGSERFERLDVGNLDGLAQAIEQRAGRGARRMNRRDALPPRNRRERDHAREVRGRRHEALERFDRHARDRADHDPVGGKAELGEHGLRDLRAYAQDHDSRAVNDRLVVRRDLDAPKALGEAGGDPGVAGREQHLLARHRRSRTTP